LTVPSEHAVLNAPEMVTATTVLASANPDLLEFHVLFQLAHHLALEMEDASLSELKWNANVMMDSKDMIVLIKLAQAIVQVMENVSVESVLVTMVGEEVIALLVALDMAKDAAEMENVLRVHAIATLVGLVMHVTSEHAFMIVLNTDIAAMVLASAKRDTEEEIALSHQSHSLVNAQLVVFVAAFNNALRFMKPKVLDHHMNVTQNALKNVFPCVSPEKCLTMVEQAHFLFDSSLNK